MVFALRRLVRSPREIPATILTLAVGVGVVGAAWALVETILIQPLPYAEPDRLVRIWVASAGAESGPSSQRTVADRQFETLRDAASLLEGLAVYTSVRGFLTTGRTTEPVRHPGLIVSSEFFDVLGVPPLRGRAFNREDEGPQAVPPAIVVSERLQSAGIIEGRLGEWIEVDGVAYSVVGVMPASFWFPDPETDYWMAMAYPGALPSPPGPRGPRATVRTYPAIARLGPDAAPDAAAAQASAILSGSEELRVEVRGLHDELTEEVRTPLLALQLAALLVLVLACANAGWLFGWRARRLSQMYAILGAIGASPGRVFRSYLVEALVVAVLAVPGALLVAWAMLRVLLSQDPGIITRGFQVELTSRGMVLTLLMALAVAVVAALPASLMIARTATHRGVLWQPRASGGRRGRQYVAMALQAGLVYAISLQAVLLTAVLRDLVGPHTGFDRTDLITARVSFPSDQALDPRIQVTRYAELLQALEVAGIDAASVNMLPLAGFDRMLSVRTRREPPFQMAGLRMISGDYFTLLGMRLIKGRFLSPADEGRHVVVVNDVLARQLFGDAEETIGRWIIVGAVWDPELEIVGVVRDVRHRGLLLDPEPEVYLLNSTTALLSNPPVGRSFFLLFPSSSAADATIDATLRAAGEVLPEATVSEVRHFEEVIWAAAGERPRLTSGVGAFALIALLLMATGFHGMIAEALADRSPEFAIRLALGATPGRVLLEGARGAVAVYAAGIVAGLTLVLALRSAVRATVFVPAGVTAPSLLSAGSPAALLLALVVAAACYGPVRRATRTDPAATLRTQ